MPLNKESKPNQTKPNLSYILTGLVPSLVNDFFCNIGSKYNILSYFVSLVPVFFFSFLLENQD